MRKFFSFVSGAMIGGLIGALLALLYTPTPGKELQEKIKLEVQSFSSQISQAAAEQRTALEKQLEELRAPLKADDK